VPVRRASEPLEGGFRPALRGRPTTMDGQVQAMPRAAPPAERPSRPATAAPDGARPRAAVRPEIQALRAVAVTLVLVYHLWPAAVPGGYVGVDVFFAISGFLITSLLLREAERHGRVSLSGFWARRARRILPAALLTVLACAIATIVLVPLTQWQQFFGEMRASTAYVQNWQLAGDAVDYLASANAPSPVQHYWSLSIEEQFYLVWPVLIAVALVVTRGRRAAPRRRLVTLVLAAATALSLVYSVVDTGADPAAAYFVTPTRAWELGAGALLALAGPFGRSPSAARAVLSWLGLTAIAVAALTYSGATPFPGHAALLPVLGALAVIRAGAPEWRLAPTRLMALAPVQRLGDISYSVYLWHWPLIVFAPFVIAADGLPVKLGIVALTLVLAALTKRFVEDPARTTPLLTARGAGWTFAAAGVATAAVLAVTAAAGSHVNDRLHAEERATARVLAAHPRCFGAAARECENPGLRDTVVPTPLQAAKRDNAPCDVIERAATVTVCAFGPRPAHATRSVALVGDSHAVHWRPAFERIAAAQRWRALSITRSGCPLSAAAPQLQGRALARCREWRGEVPRWLRAHPEVRTVFVAQHSGSRDTVQAGREAFAAQVAGFRGAWGTLPSSVDRIVVLRDTPTMPGTTPTCVERALSGHRRADTACDAPRSAALPPDPAMAAARQEGARVRRIDLSRYFCDARRCPPVIGGALVYKDVESHITDVYATTLAPYLRREVDALLPKR
jgi:peptidoglycan/LPS O-acetylase OafA/YrhL